VEGIIVVNYLKDGSQFYNYRLITKSEELLQSSKTRYYPVTLESAFVELEKFNGKVAIVGVSCFIKAIRLKQRIDENFNEKVAFLIGIICGGLKSKYYTHFLA